MIMFSGMNEASSQMAMFAVYPRSKCSLHGSAMICEPVVSWIMVRVFRVMLLRMIWFWCVRERILSNIIMLWRSDGLIMSVVVFLCAYA